MLNLLFNEGTMQMLKLVQKKSQRSTHLYEIKESWNDLEMFTRLLPSMKILEPSMARISLQDLFCIYMNELFCIC